MIIATPAQRIKPSGQTKPGRSIVRKFRKAITLTDQGKMPDALAIMVKIALERGPFLQIKLADQESRDRARDFESSTGEDAEEPGRPQHERKAQAVVVSTQPIGDLAVASVQMKILRQLIR